MSLSRLEFGAEAPSQTTIIIVQVLLCHVRVGIGTMLDGAIKAIFLMGNSGHFIRKWPANEQTYLGFTQLLWHPERK